jgi:hypothetical protein
LLPNGDVIAIWELYGIFKLDRNSRILWVATVKAHHDVHIFESGEIHYLEAMRRRIPGIEEVPATDDFIVVRDRDGVEQHRIHLESASKCGLARAENGVLETRCRSGLRPRRPRALRSLSHQLPPAFHGPSLETVLLSTVCAYGFAEHASHHRHPGIPADRLQALTDRLCVDEPRLQPCAGYLATWRMLLAQESREGLAKSRPG